MFRTLLLAALPPLGLVAAWLLMRRPVRAVREDRDFRRALLLFRLRREPLEAAFLRSLAATDPWAIGRWEDGRWLDGVSFARDRQTRRLLALVGVRFGEPGFYSFGFEEEDDDREVGPRGGVAAAPGVATVRFAYAQGTWTPDGRIEGLLPEDALRSRSDLVPVGSPPPPRIACD